MTYTDHFPYRPNLFDMLNVNLVTMCNGLGGNRIDENKTPRALSDITGITLHQMGFSATRARCRRIRAHYCLLEDGTIMQNYHHDVYVKASNRLNSSTIAIEISGNLRSERGRYFRPSQFGRGRLSEDQVIAGRWLIRYLRMRHPAIRSVYAHRQSHGLKNCCGPDIWYHIGQWSIDVLGLTDDTRSIWPHVDGPSKHGKPIPSAWTNWNQI